MESLSELTLLLVEDDPDHAELVSGQLEFAGVRRSQIHQESDLRGAIERLQEGDVDLILLDLGLPGSRGLETLELVLPHAQRTPILVLTALDDGDVGVEAVREGAQDYLVKSAVSAELLGRSIRYAIERKRVAVELERRNAELSSFAHTIAHDLKAPIRAVSVLCDFIHRDNAGSLSDESEKHLEGASNACRRMTDMVDTLLDFADIGSAGVECSPVTCEEVVAEVIRDLDVSIAESGGSVSFDLAGVTVLANQALLREVLQNLISNALKYRGDDPPRIHIEARRDAKDWVIEVRDNGMGIPERSRERIFRMFYRVDRSKSGSGVGLATCRKVIELHGGRIWIESTPGEGSSFFFTLPVAEELALETAGTGAL